MKKFVQLKVIACLIVILLITGCDPNGLLPKINQTPLETETVKYKVTDNYIYAQSKVDKDLVKELRQGYKFSDPFVTVNPYGNSPLAALVMFNTDNPTKVKMVVKGHDKSVDITNTFASAKQHIIPVYGLYPGEINTVELKLEDGSTKTIKIETEPLISILTKAKVLAKVKGKFKDGLIFCDPSTSTPQDIYTLAYDSNGDIRWYLKEKGTSLPTRRLKNGRILQQTVNLIDGNYYSVGVREMDLIGKVYNEYVVPGGQHHDHYELPNGNFMICGNQLDFTIREDIAFEIDRKTGKVINTFDMKGYFDKKDGNSFNRKDVDWFHMNSISYDEITNTIMFSGRNVDAVVGIDYTTKQLKWILGTSEGWQNIDKSKFLKPVGENFEWQYAQHAADFLPNGDLILFDNGSFRAKKTNPQFKMPPESSYSRGVRYRIDLDSMTVKQIWEFGKERGADWYSSYISDIDSLGENHYLMTSGALLPTSKIDAKSTTKGVKDTADIVEVIDKKVVFELLVNCLLYRSEKMPAYANENYHSIFTMGKYLGSYGLLPSVTGVNYDLNTSNVANFDLDVKKEYGRVIISGAWNTAKRPGGEYVVIVNETTKASFVRKISTLPGGINKQRYYAMISNEGLSGNYKLFIVAAGQTYRTKFIIEF